jgi:hypothetical protein
METKEKATITAAIPEHQHKDKHFVSQYQTVTVKCAIFFVIAQIVSEKQNGRFLTIKY